jgi:hypothetical protein
MTKPAFAFLCAAVLVLPATHAKLPPLPAEEQVKADEAKAKTAWTDTVAAYKLCRSMEHVAEVYFKTAKAAGRETQAPASTPPCADPGPYAAAGAASSPKPLEASGAHSPPAAATTPPSSKATEADLSAGKK